MKTCTAAQMNSACASTLAARTSVNVNKICTLLMANAEVISDLFKNKFPSIHSGGGCISNLRKSLDQSS